MMKFKVFFFLAVFLLNQTDCQPTSIECVFSWIPNQGIYHCLVRNQIVVDDDQQEFVIIGDHPWVDLNTDETVRALEVQETANVPFIIAELFLRFQNVFRLVVRPSGLTRLQSNAFRYAQNLQLLIINGNPLQTIQANTFVGANSLTTLELRNNQIQRLHVDSFRGLASLRDFVLENNNIRRLPRNVFLPLENVELINLSINQIEMIDGKLFTANHNIRKIDLMRNRINEVGKEIVDGLDNLETFNIFRNRCANNIWIVGGTTSIDTIRNGLSRCFENFDKLKRLRVEVRGTATISDDYGNEILSF